MLDRDKLQSVLRNLESVDVIDLASTMDMQVDELLTGIQNEILPEFTDMYKKNAYKIPFFNSEKSKEFFRNQIIDLGFLCQHIIEDIKEGLKKRHDSFAHQAFYSAWLLNRGY